MALRFKDPVSGGTHLVGALLGFAGLVFLLAKSQEHGTWKHIVGFVVFGSSLVLLYLSSAIYHLLDVSEETRRFFRRIDHSMIFVLIAGSYTPFCLLALPSPMGTIVLAAIWTVALGGFLTKIFWLHAPRRLSTALYLLMGWSIVAVILPLTRALGTVGMIWLVAGGLAYSLGAVIYALKRPDPFPNVFGFHEIWHLHVLAGSAFHFVCVARLLPV